MEPTAYPLVSVIIPCFRCFDSIDRAVLSVQKQTYPSIELLLINGGDNDPRTEESIQKVSKKYSKGPVKVLHSEKNFGPGYDRNLGIANAKGIYVAFLDADDWWEPTKIFSDFSTLKRMGCDIVCSGFLGEPKKKQINKKISLRKNLFKNKINTSTIFSKREPWLVFDKRRYLYAEDFLLWEELLAEDIFIYRYSGQLTNYSVSPNQTSKLKIKETHLAIRNCIRILQKDKKIPLLLSCCGIFFEDIKYLIRKIRFLLEIKKQKANDSK